MFNQTQLNGAIALNPSEGVAKVVRRNPSTAAAPRSISSKGADRTGRTPARGEIEAYALHASAANRFGDATVGGIEYHLHFSSARLDHRGRARRSKAWARIVETTLQTLATMLRQTQAKWKRQRQLKATYVALRTLDTRTLRDLGFDRSELLSVAAEIAGSADRTRVRAVEPRRGLSL